MDDEHRFLREIVDSDRDDEHPRLVYADWLEERGDPRGELIRVQCELAQLPHDEEEMTDEMLARKAELDARDKELQLAYDSKWLAPFNLGMRGRAFNRGLIEVVSIDAKMLVAHGAQLFHFAPVRLMTVCSLNQREMPYAGRLGKVLAVPGMERLRGLALDRPALTKEDVEALVEFLERSHVSHLVLSQCLLNDNSIEPLKMLRKSCLEELDLSFNTLTNRGAGVLATTPGLAGLTKLNLSDNRIRLRGAQALAESKILGELQSLDVGQNPLDPRGIDALRDRFNYVRS